MPSFLSALWGHLQSAVGFVLPVFAKARSFRGPGAAVRWLLHALVIAALLVGLYFLNRLTGLNRWVDSRYAAVREGWLPLLFLLVYALAWLGWWLWQLLTPDDTESAFPDIDAAWDEALAALARAGIDPTEVPIFLVLGRPASAEANLFQAAHVQLEVQAPPGRSAPLHVYANRDALYVTCAGASLLGRQAAILAGEGAAEGDGASPAPAAAEDPGKTLTPESAGNEPAMAIREIMLRAQREGRGPEQLTEEERRDIARLERKDRPRPSLMKDPAEAERHAARLGHLCRLVVRDRRPYCPINGILVLVPFAAADSDEDANQTGDALRRDLAAARRALKLHCPLLALVCDMEAAPGFREFIERFPEKQRQRRLGQRFPYVPDVSADALPKMVADGVAWVCNGLFPNWIYKQLRVEAPGKEDVAAAVTGNGRLCQLLGEMRQRQPRFARILTRGLPPEQGGPLMLGGCYIGATGADPAREQAFVAGVFGRLVDDQGILGWTDEALAEDAAARRWTGIGYAVLGAVAALIVAGLLGHYFLGAGKPGKRL